MFYFTADKNYCPRFSRVRDTFTPSCHMIDWPPGCHLPKLSVMKMCEWSFPDSKPWAASSPFVSKGSPFHQAKVQTSREFCAAPKSLPSPDDESSPSGSKTCSLHPMDSHGKDNILCSECVP